MYRDDREALLARLVALEAENARLRDEVERLRNPPPPPPPAPPVGNTLSFRIRDDAGTREIASLGEAILKIGTLPSAHLRIDDEAASRMHAVIEVTPEAVEIIDLGSAAGTRVNGVRVNRQRLVHGDAIRIGNSTIVIAMPR